MPLTQTAALPQPPRLTRQVGSAPSRAVPLHQRLETDPGPSQPSASGSAPQASNVSKLIYRITYGSKPRKRARLIARASSRCFLADTAVMRLGTILPRSET